MNKYFAPALGLLIIVFAALLVWFFFMETSATDDNATASSTAPTEDPIEVTIGFYRAWLEATQSTTTDPYQAQLLDQAVIKPELRTKIDTAHASSTTRSLEPVLCQPTVPERVGAKAVFTQADKAQVIVLARGGEEKSPYQAIVDLVVVDNAWQISDINCVQGEVAPIREFDFEQEGYLLKNVPTPLDSQYWHLVFELNGEKGHTVPLFLDGTSMCITESGIATVCTEADLTEGKKVIVRAGMTESGATVKRIEFQAQ